MRIPAGFLLRSATAIGHGVARAARSQGARYIGRAGRVPLAPRPSFTSSALFGAGGRVALGRGTRRFNKQHVSPRTTAVQAALDEYLLVGRDRPTQLEQIAGRRLQEIQAGMRFLLGKANNQAEEQSLRAANVALDTIDMGDCALSEAMRRVSRGVRSRPVADRMVTTAGNIEEAACAYEGMLGEAMRLGIIRQ